MKRQLELLLPPNVRASDPPGSHDAAALVAPSISETQALVVAAFVLHGPMTARTAERLSCFGAYGFSTIRKRISELQLRGVLEACPAVGGSAPGAIYRVANR